MIFEFWRMPGSTTVFPADSPKHRAMLTMSDDEGMLEEWAELVLIVDLEPDKAAAFMKSMLDNDEFHKLPAIYRIIQR